MKHTLLILIMLLAASCSDALRTRVGSCASSENRFSECASSNDSLTFDKFQKIYLAVISLDVSVSESKVVFKDNADDMETDKNYTCELSASSGKQFTYSINKNELTLKDGISTLNFTRTKGDSVDGIVGNWIMQTDDGKVLTITELEFDSLNFLRITKNCKVR